MSDCARAACGRCEGPPERLDVAGRIFVWPPVGHSLGKLARGLANGRRPFERRGADGCLVLEVGPAEASSAAAGLAAMLTGEEARATRALFVPGRGEPGLADFPRVATLDRVVAAGRGAWVAELLTENRLTSHFQPIVHAGDPSRVFAHEALLRGVEPDGTLIPPARIFEAAREADIVFQVDLAARRTAIASAVRQGIATPIFVNFTPTSVYDPAFCLRSTVAVVEAAGIAPSDVVFEVIESDRAVDVSHLKRILDFYRANGFRVALDDVGAGYSSLNLVHELRPDIIKLDMELTCEVHADAYKALIVRKLLEVSDELGIETVAEGVERDEDYRWLRDHGATYVQGFLFGVPGPSPKSARSVIPATPARASRARPTR